MRVLIWNLFHGRSRPGAGRSLVNEFAAAIASWDWDVALLQEVPPWWPVVLGHAAGAEHHSVLTSRNFGLPVRRAIACRNPDVLKAQGGGANTILVRPPLRAFEHRSARLTLRPERRYAHGIRLHDGWVVNLHASVRPLHQIPRDIDRAGAAARRWARAQSVLLGGDFNSKLPVVPDFQHLGGRWVDHLLGRGFEAAGPIAVLEAGSLSDHKPILVDVESPQSPLA